ARSGTRAASTGRCLRANPSPTGRVPRRRRSQQRHLSGTQPANADTLFAWVEGGMGGCGSDTFGTVSFTPGSPVSLALSLVAKSPCRYQPNLPKAEVDAGFVLQS